MNSWLFHPFLLHLSLTFEIHNPQMNLFCDAITWHTTRQHHATGIFLWYKKNVHRCHNPKLCFMDVCDFSFFSILNLFNKYNVIYCLSSFPFVFLHLFWWMNSALSLPKTDKHHTRIVLLNCSSKRKDQDGKETNNKVREKIWKRIWESSASLKVTILQSICHSLLPSSAYLSLSSYSTVFWRKSFEDLRRRQQTSP